MGLRLIREMCRRRHIRPRHARYVSKRRVKRAAKAFDERVTSWQRVELRLGGAKRPTDLAASVDKARSLRSINENLEAILDVLRFAVGYQVSYSCVPGFLPVLTLDFVSSGSPLSTMIRLLLRHGRPRQAIAIKAVTRGGYAPLSLRPLLAILIYPLPMTKTTTTRMAVVAPAWSGG